MSIQFPDEARWSFSTSFFHSIKCERSWQAIRKMFIVVIWVIIHNAAKKTFRNATNFSVFDLHIVSSFSFSQHNFLDKNIDDVVLRFDFTEKFHGNSDGCSAFCFGSQRFRLVFFTMDEKWLNVSTGWRWLIFGPNSVARSK